MDWYINDEDGITDANGETYPGLGKSKEEKAQVKHSNPLQRRDREERARALCGEDKTGLYNKACFPMRGFHEK